MQEEKGRLPFQFEDFNLNSEVSVNDDQLNETIHQMPNLTLQAMPNDIARKIHSFYYDSSNGDALRTTSRHFYGKTPEVDKWSNTKKYTKAAGYFCFNLAKGCSELTLDKCLCPSSNQISAFTHPEDICDCIGNVCCCFEKGLFACCTGPILGACWLLCAGSCCVLSIPSSIFGCIVGCAIDTKNNVKSAYQGNQFRDRPEVPREGFVSLQPDAQIMF